MKKNIALFVLIVYSYSSTAQADSCTRAFIAAKGNLIYPVDHVSAIENDEQRQHRCNKENFSKAVTFYSDSARVVSAVFNGKVISLAHYDDIFFVIIKSGDYYISYSNLSVTTVKNGGSIKAGEPIGNMAKNLDGIYSVDLQLANSTNNDIDLYPWFRPIITGNFQ